MKFFVLFIYILFFSNFAIAESLTEKLKNSIKSAGDIAGSLSFSKKEEPKKEEKPKNKIIKKATAKKKQKVIKEIIRVPPPDVKIFEDKPFDVSLIRPISFLKNGYYNVENVYVFEDSGDTVGESIEVATRVAVDIAFSNLVIDLNLSHIFFTMQDAAAALSDIYVVSEQFSESDYLGNFTVLFSEKVFNEILNAKRKKLFESGFDEYLNPINKLILKAVFVGKSHLSEIENRVNLSNLTYSIVAMSSHEAVIEVSGNGINMIEAMKKNGLHIDNKKDAHYVKIIELMANED